MAASSLTISHLFFVDNSLFFVRANMLQTAQLKAGLTVYEGASSQCINLQKSAVSFSSNVLDEDRDTICQHFGIQEIEAHDTNLGMPTVVRHDRTKAFHFIVKKVAKRLAGWK
ncbi:hypothetical protein MANES_01G037766v8 [Manihot esculenta]|uniref:Uncharacterized protein n=1 Tax=Manihot esculenta TaxID=3983 RepID=A0ACB7ICI7_MANES|nr:hypothetical protein MANES_01G037766v8 [Manihot esculenta]